MPRAARREQNENKVEIKSEARQHIPYILNGELYRIESQIGDNVTVKCVYCPPDRIYRGSVRSTGNFHMHIKRRHASLLGKLHEMKVAALVERRDRINKNRRIAAKGRNKSTTTPIPTTTPVAVTGSAEEETPTATAAAKTAAATTISAETHELKIKTVFQRHKQEHNEQEEAAAIRTSLSTCDSSMDNNSQSSISSTQQDNNNNDNTTNNNNNNNAINSITTNAASYEIVQHLENAHNLLNMNSGVFPTYANLPLVCNESIEMPIMVNIPRLLPFNRIKPERQEQQPQPLVSEQPVALDLSRTSSMQSDDTNNGLAVNTNEQNIQAEHLMALNNGREALLRIDNSLSDIKDELKSRNIIERKRFLFDVAKFKFLHPTFDFNNGL